MRLRQTTRPPSRYRDECELSPGVSPRRLPRRRRTAVAAAEDERVIPYVDYDPNHPPAAFPTLDQPLPAGQTFHSRTATTTTTTTTTSPLSHPPPSTTAAATADADSSTAGVDFEADDHHLDAFDSLYRGIKLEEVDNFVASNGPQNPQYRRNMALLAREDDEFNLDISDDDDEQQALEGESDSAQWTHREEPIPDEPQWSDIPLSLQIEIADNMLENHRWSTIQILLGLKQADMEQLRRNIQMQNKDLDYENRVLEEMRNKQLEALMCLDNSDLRQHSVPARLVMSRKVWSQCHRTIQKKTQMRHLLCQAGDLLLARKFLSKRGLSMAYAGEWDNQFVATPSISEAGIGAETLEWKSTIAPQLDAVAAAEDNTLMLSHPLHAPTWKQPDGQVVSLANPNDLPFVRFPLPDTYEPMPRSSTHPASTNRNVHPTLPDQAIVRLRIGPKNAARIHIDQPVTQSRRRMDTVLARTQRPTREPSSDDTIEELPTELVRPDVGHRQDSRPVRRIFGAWPTGDARHQSSNPLSSTMPLSGSFNNVTLSEPSTAISRTPPIDQTKISKLNVQPAIDAACSITSSPPRLPDLSAMDDGAFANRRDLTVKNAIPTPAASSPNYNIAAQIASDDRHNRLPKTSLEMFLATPMSQHTIASDKQTLLGVPAREQSLISPSAGTEIRDSQSTNTSLARSDGVIDPNIFSPSRAMQRLNLLPSIIELANGQRDGIDNVVDHEIQPETTQNCLHDEAPQKFPNSLKTPQPVKRGKFTNPLFDFDSFDIHTDDQQLSQNVNIGHSNQHCSSTGQAQAPADTIDISGGGSTLTADVSKAGVVEPPSISKNADVNLELPKDGPGDHLTAISANVYVDTPASTRRTRQSARKQTTSTKRDASTETKVAQPKRGKKSTSTATPTPTSTAKTISNPTTLPATNPPVSRGRGRPRKHPIQK